MNEETRPYFIGFKTDFFFLCGISLVVWALVMSLIQGGSRTEWTYQIAVFFSIIVNWPHFAATSYRFYHRKDFIRQFPMTAIVVPALVIVATFYSILHPESLAIIWVKFYLIWSPYHFSGQSVGLSVLYARRGKMELDRYQRFFLAAFIYGTFIVMTAAAEVGTGTREYYGVKFPSFDVPYWLVQGLWYWQALTAIGLIVTFARPVMKNFKFFPWMVLFLPAVQAFWFLLGPRWAGFNEFVPALHSLQYLFIALMLQLSERHQSGAVLSRRSLLLKESGRWYGVNIFLGVILFWILPHIAEKYGLLNGLSAGFASGVVLASVQIHHFFVDGVIWKLKNPKVRSPLMGSWTQWTSSPEKTI